MTFASQVQDQQTELVQKAKTIHEKIMSIDSHNDINTSNFTNSLNYTTNLNTQVNLPKMEEGSLDVSWLIVYTGQGELSARGYKSAHQKCHVQI